MERNQIREVLRSIFADEIGEPLDDFPDEVSLAEKFDLDSVDMVSMIMQVERHFRVHLTYDDLVEVKTAGALIDVVQAKLKEQAETDAKRAAA